MGRLKVLRGNVAHKLHLLREMIRQQGALTAITHVARSLRHRVYRRFGARHTLQSRYFNHDTVYLGRLPRRWEKPVLVVSRIELCPATQGNRQAVTQLVDWLKSQGRLTVLAIQTEFDKVTIDAHRPLLSQVEALVFIQPRGIGPESALDKYNEACAGTLVKLHRRCGFQAAIAVYAAMARNLSRLPRDVLRYVMTIDVVSRYASEPMFRELDLGTLVAPTAEAESGLLSHADILIAIQEHERALLQQLLPDRGVITMGYAMQPQPIPNPANETILFVGGANPFNIDGIRQFLAEGWPILRQLRPSAMLQVAGAAGLSLPDPLPEGVTRLGVLSDLAAPYRAASIVINPVRAGTGLKIKTIEAMGYGKPVVTTPVGAEGILMPAGQPAPVCLADTMPAMAEAIAGLLADPAAAAALGKRALEYIRRHASMSATYQPLKTTLMQPALTMESWDKPLDPALNAAYAALMEAQSRVALAGGVGVVVTSNRPFAKAVAAYAKMHGLGLKGIYTDSSALYGQSWEGIPFRPLAAAAQDGVSQLLIPTFDKSEWHGWQSRARVLGLSTLGFLPNAGEEQNERWWALQNRHKGETAYIIGNGPSVRVEDLNALAGKLTFAANRFHLSYPNHNLRPTYTASCDLLMLEQHGAEIIAQSAGELFLYARGTRKCHIPAEHQPRVTQYDYRARPKGPFPQVAFGDDPTQGFGNGASVVYDLIQIAAWMGVSRIVLYGIDHHFAVPADNNGAAVKTTGEQNHFIPGYRKPQEVWYTPVTPMIDKAFEVAKIACAERGIEILNATHGGNLNLFPRAPLASFLEPKTTTKTSPRKKPSKAA